MGEEKKSIDIRKQTIGVVAISYNEEEDMPGFIEHLLSWIDEIVIVDDCSTDKTFEIAERVGGKVKIVQHKMSEEGGFAEQRNYGMQLSTCDWVLHMDIDERVSYELYKEIVSVTKDSKYYAFKYRRKNYFLHRPMHYGGLGEWNNPQLARRNKHRFKNRVHEKCIVDGGKEMIGQINSYMLHLNDSSFEERIRKSTQYTKMEADKIIKSNRNIYSYEIIIRPIYEFIKKYIIKMGFLDGVPGLIFSIHSASAVFRVYAMVWDEKNRINRKELEREIKKRWSYVEK